MVLLVFLHMKMMMIMMMMTTQDSDHQSVTCCIRLIIPTDCTACSPHIWISL